MKLAGDVKPGLRPIRSNFTEGRRSAFRADAPHDKRQILRTETRSVLQVVEFATYLDMVSLAFHRRFAVGFRQETGAFKIQRDGTSLVAEIDHVRRPFHESHPFLRPLLPLKPCGRYERKTEEDKLQTFHVWFSPRKTIRKHGVVQMKIRRGAMSTKSKKRKDQRLKRQCVGNYDLSVRETPFRGNFSRLEIFGGLCGRFLQLASGRCALDKLVEGVRQSTYSLAAG